MIALIMQGYVSAKSVVSAITWLLLIMAIIILSGVWYFLTTLDNQVDNELRQRVELALKIEDKHARDILGEYTYWDASYQHIFVAYNAQWIELNSGLYLLHEFDLDFSVAIEQSEQEKYLIKSDNASTLSFDDIMNSGLRQLIEHSSLQNSEKKIASGFIKINKDVYFVVGGPLINEITTLPRTNAYLALGKRVDESYLEELKSNYQLFGLNKQIQTAQQFRGMALQTANGDHIAQLTWVANLPSDKILLPISLIVVLLFICAALITRRILNKELNNRTAYEEQLYLEATTDHLTKINNRRYFMDMGNKEFYLCQHRNRICSLMLLDIDHFKLINDTYGHQVGDDVLIHIAQLCNRHLKQSGILGRIGGEEFGVVLPDTNGAQARVIANQIRAAIMQTPFIQPTFQIKVTVSIGIATLQQQEHFDELIQEADKALYHAKDQGRNMVISVN
jgi:diguanylate cyclase (GGDEF)-like protein